MPKGFPKRGDELIPLEGGGSGSGSRVSSGVSSMAKELVGGAAIAGGLYGVGKLDREATKEADKKREESREINSRAQYEHEREAGDPNALQMSYSEWKKL